MQDKRKGAKSRSGSVSMGTEGEEEMKKQVKKGIFGMFRKKDSSSTRKQQEDKLMSPMRPIRRM